MHEVFFDKPQSSPVAIASTATGLTVHRSEVSEKRGQKRKGKVQEELVEVLTRKLELEERRVRAVEHFNALFEKYVTQSDT